MTTGTMTLEAFQRLIDTYGGNSAAWPADDQAAAAALLGQSADANAVLDAARALDQALQQSLPKAPKGMVDRIMAASGAAMLGDDENKRSKS